MPGDVRHDFDKLKRLPPYVLAEVIELMKTARRGGEDIIDLGMGNPDMPTPPHVVEKICEAARDPRNHRYSASKGIPNLRAAITEWYARNHQVDLVVPGHRFEVLVEEALELDPEPIHVGARVEQDPRPILVVDQGVEQMLDRQVGMPAGLRLAVRRLERQLEIATDRTHSFSTPARRG